MPASRFAGRMPNPRTEIPAASSSTVRSLCIAATCRSSSRAHATGSANFNLVHTLRRNSGSEAAPRRSLTRHHICQHPGAEIWIAQCVPQVLPFHGHPSTKHDTSLPILLWPMTIRRKHDRHIAQTPARGALGARRKCCRSLAATICHRTGCTVRFRHIASQSWRKPTGNRSSIQRRAIAWRDTLNAMHFNLYGFAKQVARVL